MRQYVRYFFFNYLLMFFCLAIPGILFFMSFLWSALMILILFAIYYSFKRKDKLTPSLILFNFILTIIVVVIFSLCMVISKGYMSHSIWVLYHLITAPFYPLAAGMMFMGMYLDARVVIIVILACNTLISYFYLKPHISLQKVGLVIVVMGLLGTMDYHIYSHSPAHKYKGGHDFEYMNGYSSTDLSVFYPYNPNNQLVTLKEPSTFTIENEADMPILDGAEACYPVYSAIAKAVYKNINLLEEKYNKIDDYQYTNGKIVSFTNTSQGYSRLINGEVDMFFGAKPSASQLNEAKEQGVEFEYTPIGKEAFVFFVDQNNPVHNLSTDQVKSIYHGDITNWKDVGGSQEDIIAFQRPERSGSQAMMNYFMGDVSLKEPLTYEILSGMTGIIQEVAEYQNEKGAIGYTFKYFLEGLHQEENVRILSINNIAPTTENIKKQSYPFSTYLYCVTLKSNTKKNVQKLKDYLLSPQGQYIIEKTGYCALK